MIDISELEEYCKSELEHNPLLVDVLVLCEAVKAANKIMNSEVGCEDWTEIEEALSHFKFEEE